VEQQTFLASTCLLAVLYLDFHPRKGKQGGAWMTSFRDQHMENGQNIIPHVSVVCNFTPPTASRPSLLTFNEVTTFLHEFGHALHGMLSEVTYESLSGTSVYRDFVELPSQIMENWALEKEWLQDVAVHYQTGETMPEDLIQKIIAADNFQSGYLTVRQLSFGFNDMAWHSITEPIATDAISFEKAAMAKTTITRYIPTTTPLKKTPTPPKTQGFLFFYAYICRTEHIFRFWVNRKNGNKNDQLLTGNQRFSPMVKSSHLPYKQCCTAQRPKTTVPLAVTTQKPWTKFSPNTRSQSPTRLNPNRS